MSELEKHSWQGLHLLEGDIVSLTLREGNHWNPHVYHALEPCLNGYAWVLEAGANVGALTLRFAEKAGGVIAFEPNRTMAECLHQNLVRQGLMHKSTICEFGLYSRPVLLAPPVTSADSPSSWPWTPSTRNLAIRAWPLSPSMLGWHCPRVSAIKVDVQGADLHALQGCDWLIRSDRPAIVFEFEEELSRLHGHSWDDYTIQLKDWGYRWEKLGEFDDYLALPK